MSRFATIIFDPSFTSVGQKINFWVKQKDLRLRPVLTGALSEASGASTCVCNVKNKKTKKEKKREKFQLYRKSSSLSLGLKVLHDTSSANRAKGCEVVLNRDFERLDWGVGRLRESSLPRACSSAARPSAARSSSNSSSDSTSSCSIATFGTFGAFGGFDKTVQWLVHFRDIFHQPPDQVLEILCCSNRRTI